MSSLTAKKMESKGAPLLLRELLRTTRRNKLGAVGFLVLLFLLFSVSVLPGLLGLEAEALNPRHKLLPPLASVGGSTALLGTDQLGRDIFSRVLFGGRISLLVGLSTVILSTIIGVGVGLLAGFYGGWFDNVVMRIVDTQLAIPTILFAILVMATLGASIINLVLVMAVASWMVFARVMRANVLSIKESPMVEAARAAGAGDIRILIKHVLLNSWTPILVVATQQIAQMILLESSLSFLGIGVPISVPTWGAMVRDGRLYLELAWWVPLVPGIALALTVLSINFLGDALRDVLDPHTAP